MTPDTPNADAWRRLMSLTYEAVILFGVVFFFGYAFSALTQFKGHPGALRWAFDLYLFGVLGAYFTYFWSAGRRTLPMKTMAVVVLGPDERPISAWRAFGRYTAAVALLLLALAALRYVSAWLFPLLALPWVTTPFDARRRAIHDIVSGTRLAYAPLPGRGRRAEKTADA